MGALDSRMNTWFKIIRQLFCRQQSNNNLSLCFKALFMSRLMSVFLSKNQVLLGSYTPVSASHSSTRLTNMKVSYTDQHQPQPNPPTNMNHVQTPVMYYSDHFLHCRDLCLTTITKCTSCYLCYANVSNINIPPQPFDIEISQLYCQ